MTREEFIAGYCARSNITRAQFDSHCAACRCFCTEPECEGWAAVSHGLVEFHMATDGVPTTPEPAEAGQGA